MAAERVHEPLIKLRGGVTFGVSRLLQVLDCLASLLCVYGCHFLSVLPLADDLIHLCQRFEKLAHVGVAILIG